MNTKTFFLLGMVMTTFFCFFLDGVKGDNLFSFCKVEDEEPEFDFQLMAFTDPQPGVCAWPRFAGGLDASVIEWLSGLGIAGIHVDYNSGLLHGAAAHEFNDPAFVYDTKRQEPQLERKENEGTFLGEFGSVHGGQTELRKWTSYSPNGRVDFTGGHVDATYSTVAGPGLTGDCSSRFYTFDQMTGFLSGFGPVSSNAGAAKFVQTSMGVSNPNFGYNIDDKCSGTPEVYGLTYSPQSGLFWTAYSGFVNNDTVLFVTSLNPATRTSQTVYVNEFTLLDNGAWIPSDGIEISSDGQSLWLMVVDITSPTRSLDDAKDEKLEKKMKNVEKLTRSSRCRGSSVSPHLEAAYRAEVKARKAEGRSPPLFITQFYQIDLASATLSVASEPYWGLLCQGLTQVSPAPCRRTRSDPMSFEAILGNPEQATTPAKRSVGIRS